MPYQTFLLPTSDGWLLPLHRHSNPGAIDHKRPPIVCIPGYGMNSFILTYHPTEDSLITHLVSQGWDVWSINLRGQQGTRRTSGSKRIGMRQLALFDIPAAIHGVLRRRRDHQEVTLVGCSLGAAMSYAYLAHHPMRQERHVGAMVAIGGPLQWRDVHPLVELAFQSKRLAHSVPIVGTKQLARLALPLAKRAPDLLSFYLNARNIDVSGAKTLIQTIDDPTPYLNGQLARWIKNKNLQVAGLDIPLRLQYIDPMPLLCILANQDGVVPPATAKSVLDFFPATHSHVVVAGDDTTPFAHADLFIANGAQAQVFEPLEAWLTQHQPHSEGAMHA